MKKLRTILSVLVFSLITTSLFAETLALDIFSTEDNPTYYLLQFKAGGCYISDKGAGEMVETANFDEVNPEGQQWAFIGNAENFVLKSMAGNYLVFNSESRFATSETEKTELYIIETANANAEGCYEIGRVGSENTFNQHEGSGAGRKIAEYAKGDNNNPLQIVALPDYPKMSDSKKNYWYFIQFENGGWAIEDKGVGNEAKTASVDTNNKAQLWKVTGSASNCQFINKNGNYLTCVDGTVKTATKADSKGFKIAATADEGVFEIMHIGTENKGFNMHGGAGSDKKIALWNSGDGGNRLSFVLLDDMLGLAEFEIEDYIPTAPEEKLTLWYTKPATANGVSNPWMEYSLPLGNGQLGASLFGGVARDEILFNEKTLWSGGPNEYGYYLPFGSVYIDDISGDFESSPVKNYYRDLNLKTATGTVTYENAEGVKFTRQYIASNPDKAIVTKISASEAGKLNFRIKMESGKPTVKAKTTYDDGYAQFTGKLQTVSYNATLKVVATNGRTTTSKEGIKVENADEVLIVLVGSTDFVGNDKSHVNGNAENLPADNKAQADAVAEKGWDAVYAAHVADHQNFFTRVELELDGVENSVPTNELIIAYNAASGARNLMLEQLYYNYGRYLSIASSRGTDLPNNLQGIWNNTCTPPWHSDIHANINVQMNYWPVSAGNLNEMYEPFLNYIINEAAQPEWQERAKIAGQQRGWTCLTENNIFGGISGFAPNYVIANAWYVTHLWQHYRYTLDKEYLAKAFPAMLGASQFWADRMVLAEDGTYECPNEYSPEHGPGSENAVAHAQQIAWECFDNTLKAADILGGVAAGVISQDDYDLIKDRFTKMDKGLATEEYTGDWGATYNGVATGEKILREWKYSKFTASSDRGHRHMSHLMALFPFGQLTPASEFFEPAINSMKLRGDESTGWSMGWKINLWARALMGDRSHAILRKALKHSTTYGTDQGQGGIYYNLFDSHAPFQIDGNFGATSGVNEMLLQSHTDVIDILPALPSEWSKGSVKGLKAVGDFTVDIEWSGNQASKVEIVNNQGQPCYVKCNALDEAVITVNGAAAVVGDEETVNGLACRKIESEAGDVIVIDLSNAKQTNTTALKNIVKETENLINDCYDYFTTEVALQTTDLNAAYYVSTNAQSADEGPIKDLVDGNGDTYFHSEYRADKGGVHYIEVALGAGNELSSFRFKYATRKTDTNFPKTIEVHGSNDGTTFELIETVTGLPTGNRNANVLYKSGVIKAEKDYSYLRFYVTATNTNNAEAGGNVYFHMAEFDLMPRTEDFVNKYPTAEGVPAAVEAARTAIATAENALQQDMTAVEYNAALMSMQEAYDKLVEAMYVPVSEIVLNEAEKTLEKGATFTLVATINPADATENAILWSTSKNSVATVANGVVKAVGAGTATITAKAGDKIVSCAVKVVIPVESIVLNEKTAKLAVDDTLTLEATVNPEEATDAAVTWSSSDESIATVENGVVTAKSIGKATITATAGGRTTTCEISVEIFVEEVTLDIPSVTLEYAETVTLKATIAPADATDKNIIWSSSNLSVATVKDGVVTAVGAGTAIITAKAGDKTATCEITVKPVPVDGITLSQPSASMVVGDNLTLKAEVTPDYATDKTVTWETSDANVATVKNGVVTAVGAGAVVITAKAGDKTAQCAIVVELPAGIDGVESNVEYVVYDLKGNKVLDKENMKRGVYIINGVKTVVK